MKLVSNTRLIFGVKTLYEFPINTHKRSQRVMSTPYDLRQQGKIAKNFWVVFTGVKF